MKISLNSLEREKYHFIVHRNYRYNYIFQLFTYFFEPEKIQHNMCETYYKNFQKKFWRSMMIERTIL